ncbi:hypothetical protein F7734_21535 [Scytonema sp. UIC 10036]|uniref:hypothetical protein n=1 Tax=Scytonema sp. UIC 10036 TaxID=2304196 RepID=UPI0012DA73E9|nr:hypothetical protein [Scytonema sp. UIC 10036]MUG94807.1 hypothetical protein [Scytonema sp. UIC 10036]
MKSLCTPKQKIQSRLSNSRSDRFYLLKHLQAIAFLKKSRLSLFNRASFGPDGALYVSEYTVSLFRRKSTYFASRV